MIDLEKAFDNVKWSFIDQVLQAMGFGSKWRMWIQGCIKRIPFSILVNGSACGRFVNEKGIRQGDPLSPFLFLLVSEVLTHMFEKATLAGWIGGFTVKKDGIEVSHLQFADDTLVFLDAKVEQLRYLKYILLCFDAASGLHTNFSKTSLFAVGDITNMDGLTEVMGCASGSFSCQLLGDAARC